MKGFGLTFKDDLHSLTGLLLIRDNDVRDLKTPTATRALSLRVIAHPFEDLVNYVTEVSNDHGWATAVQMGHAHPARTSIPTYVHGLDLLLSVFLQENRVFGVNNERHLGEREQRDTGPRRDWCRKDADLDLAPLPSEHLNGLPHVAVARRSKRTSSSQEVFARAFGLEVVNPEDETAQLDGTTALNH